MNMNTTPSNRRAKTVAMSRAEQVHIVTPVDLNGSYTLFGGILMQWIDIVAGVVSRRHAETETRTAVVDHLEFLAPAHINDTVTIVGKVTCVGRTSMEICVETLVEEISHPEQKTLVNRAYLTMVAIGEDGKPTPVPDLIPETIEEKMAYAEGIQRRLHRKRQAGRA